MLVHDAEVTRECAGKTRPLQARSFISFPITFGPRKVGVVNLTTGWACAVRPRDLALLELMSPASALIIDRTEWHRKA